MPTLNPRDYHIVHCVFISLTHADWFDKSEANANACAKYVLMQYGAGGLNELELQTKCEGFAREWFAVRH